MKNEKELRRILAEFIELQEAIEDSKCPKCGQGLDLLPCSRIHLNLHEERMKRQTKAKENSNA